MPIQKQKLPLLERLLLMLRDQGEEAVFSYIRREILGNP